MAQGPPPNGSADTKPPLFSETDYPPLALALKQEGAVRTELTVGVDGRVKACRILESSNSFSLDTATCDILIARATFKPAKDAAGNPIESQFVTPRIVWQLYGKKKKN